MKVNLLAVGLAGLIVTGCATQSTTQPADAPPPPPTLVVSSAPPPIIRLPTRMGTSKQYAYHYEAEGGTGVSGTGNPPHLTEKLVVPTHSNVKPKVTSKATSPIVLMSKREAPPESNSYAVKLSVDSSIKLPGPGGVLRVWIGDPGHVPEASTDMIETSKLIPKVGAYANIEPRAIAFEVVPTGSKCIEVDPTGSTVDFVLHPKRTGTFKVSATINLYNDPECSGPAKLKPAPDLVVRVVVDNQVIWSDRITNFTTVFWTKLLDFWGEILAGVSGIVALLFRKHIAKWLHIP